ncbi:uncharacterized protein P884DRAFT_269614 [Thermothelomyces heterothallicus CBS 202.75]|uniref:uncharacterized protein n=1 Tax=Thermothelomyces heterothallicus CBS 202.75 TaxID=1149848 RepID=UPI00374226BA
MPQRPFDMIYDHIDTIVSVKVQDIKKEDRRDRVIIRYLVSKYWAAEIEVLGGGEETRLYVVRCDITDVQSVEKTAVYCRQSLTPVRGLFHAGMVLKDRPLAKMTQEVWNSVLAPKFFGTLNLDKAFASPDPRQPGARSHPIRYASVDLPLVNETSALVDMRAESRDFVGKGSILFDVRELQQLMDYSMDPSVQLERPFFHSIMGFDRQSMEIGSGNYVWAAIDATAASVSASSSSQAINGTNLKVLKCCALPDKEARAAGAGHGEALENHIRNIAHFALSDDEVYEAIRRDADDPAVDNWVSRYLAEDFHLRMRQPLQYTSFIAINHPSPVPHTQAERAALLAATAFRFNKAVDDGTVEFPSIMDTPVCRDPLRWLFNTYRRPGVGMDEMRKGAGDYCVVFRRDRLFRVPLQEEKEEMGTAPASLDALRAAMKAILDHLLAASPANAEYFQTTEDAAFAVHLDDSSPVGYAELAKQCKLGDGFNRWHDKPLQFVVTANGNSDVMVEHSYLDGTTPAPLFDRLRDVIAAHRPSKSSGGGGSGRTTTTIGGPPPPREIPLVLPVSLDAHIATLRERWREASASRDFVSYELPTLGAHLLGQNKVPPSRAATTSSASWRCTCTTAAASCPTGSPSCWPTSTPTGVPKAAVFDDALLKRAMDFTAVTDINHTSVESITTPLDPSVLRLRYTICDDHSLISLNCPAGAAEKLIQSVNEAAAIIRNLSLAR